MRIVVFDDRRSLAHLGLGILSVMWPWIWIVFSVYEMVEFCLRRGKRRREKIGEFIGDLVEFLVGAGVAGMLLCPSNILGIVGIVVGVL
ncbi:MAG: hypothetical protein J7J44_07625 [Deltaproteobacteria bacterium]|nr:hypothetical protein [Deltaproteobacteria bacterium]